MKKEIHPKYETTRVECACGNSFETRSTQSPVIKVELCSVCHPFFTGKQKFLDTAGRVDKFRARMEAFESKKVKTKKAEPKAEKTEETVADVVNELEAPVAPMEVTQEVTADTEAAAAEELEIAKEDSQNEE